MELVLIAIALSMDAFAVATCKGLCMKRLNQRHALIIALFFGGFQAVMPLILTARLHVDNRWQRDQRNHHNQSNILLLR